MQPLRHSSIFLDKHGSHWLDEPWVHVGLITLMLAVFGIFLFFPWR